MFSAEQYRAKAAEYAALLTHFPRSPNETREFRNLEQTYTTLAENEEWIAINIGKTVRRRKTPDGRTDLDDESEEQILRCVTMAAVMRANAVSTKLQQELTGGTNLSISPPPAASTVVTVD
jgi:hypothetical protein